ncbi:flagellin N-terminal helical domain-containing protein [Massilia timonae]|uniref:flagellin N-terminal helical domain-containing protein n=1 Tax=Massilia timonae TaxID=47229 RepID=UPI0028D65F35|nr:flagellin [Massilia timonae]
MANVINTNISSLNAQRNLSTSQSSLATSLQRLSTGLRINSAKDDAAGQAISTRMTAQINGMQQASRNANDGISMSQTAEGAMGSINDILLRMRDLSVQSSNGTNGTAERITIQNEVDQLYQEIDRISGSTDFNGLKLLDGSAKNNSFQVGANAGQTISFGINEVSTKAMSLNSGSALGDLNSGRVSVPAGDAANPAATTGDLVINGKKIEFPTDDEDTADVDERANSPKEYAAAINASSGLTGVTASAYNAVTGLSGASGVTSGLQITVDNADGTEGAPITIEGSSSMSDLVDKINKQVGGISASIGKDGGLSLTNDTGAKITIGGNIEGSGLKLGSNEGFLSLKSADGKPITLASGTGDNSTLNKFGFNASTGAGTVTASTKISTATTDQDPASAIDAINTNGGPLTATDTVKINGIAIGTSGASAGEKAAAINAVKDKTGVTATASTTAYLKLDMAEAGAFTINGASITGLAATDDTAAVVKKINDAGISGITASTDEATGSLKLTSASGSDIVLGNTNNFIKDVSSDPKGNATPVPIAGGEFMAIRGELKLSGENGAAVRIEGEAASVAKLGLVAQGGSDETIGGKLDVTTQANAQSAIARIDKAISYVAEQRATMGAVQNRLNTTISNLATATENTTSARSRIQDTDFATETANMTRGQILQQAGTAMLAQANSLPNGVLSLLRG